MLKTFGASTAKSDRKASVFACAFVLFICGAHAGVAEARPVACPSARAIAAAPFRDVRTRVFIVRHFDSAGGVLRGEDLRTGKPAVAVLCNTVQIDAPVPNATSIHYGDVAYTKEIASGKGAFVAVEVALNVWTSIVRIERVNGERLYFMELNYHTLRPLTKIYPPYLGAVPDAGLLESNAQVFDSTRPVRISSALIGRLAKIYGYKAPNLRLIDIFRIELLRIAPRICSAANDTHAAARLFARALRSRCYTDGPILLG